jgi:hypothetical protein
MPVTFISKLSDVLGPVPPPPPPPVPLTAIKLQETLLLTSSIDVIL